MSEMTKTTLLPCPFCGVKLIHVYGKRVNRYYKGEPTLYEHPPKQTCFLGRYGKLAQVREMDIKEWNTRAGRGRLCETKSLAGSRERKAADESK